MTFQNVTKCNRFRKPYLTYYSGRADIGIENEAKLPRTIAPLRESA